MDHQDESPSPSARVKLVASTGDITAGPAPAAARDSRGDGDIRAYFETAQWTADGTTLLTSSSSNEVSGYIVPADLLSARPAPHALTPSARIPLPEPSSVLAGAPYFDLSSPWTHQVLVSAQDHPLQLFYLDPNTTTTTAAASASYPLTKDPRSETLLAATSLVWPAPGTHFVAGARSLLARYDASRAGDGPVSRIRTIPSERHLAKGGGVGMRGAVSALGHEPLGGRLIAAGTWTRWVGLYDFGAGAGEMCVATWSIASAADGDGVTQTVWSPCGRYLVVAERTARAALVYDVRVTGRLLGWLAGREAACNQRIGCDVFPGQHDDDGGGFEVWSGSAGGAVRVWEGVGGREGAHAPAWGWRAHDRSAVGSACVHMSGSVVATCAGSWEFPDVEEEGGEGEGEGEKRMPWMRRRNKESSLKIWSIEGGGQGDEDNDERREEDEEEEAKLE
ncbi:hypothetical protein F5X96DRAFT_678705 [Biscogniauxia mediterranea]|nr:hypothetical protein F5X96DRAFT_678705 [Biscogniauxia mediterranea]